jgi:hypothetical protein
MRFCLHDHDDVDDDDEDGDHDDCGESGMARKDALCCCFVLCVYVQCMVFYYKRCADVVGSVSKKNGRW